MLVMSLDYSEVTAAAATAQTAKKFVALINATPFGEMDGRGQTAAANKSSGARQGHSRNWRCLPIEQR